jgi:hypothetical protein
LLPAPSQPFTSLRLVQKDGLAQTSRAFNAAPAQETASLLQISQTDSGPLLQWGSPEVPALVRVSSDGGATWETLGVDVLGGELALDPQALPTGSLHFEVALADGNTTLVLDQQN